jgi:hypothetical protein
MTTYPQKLTVKQIEKLRDRAQSCVGTYTPPAKMRTDAWEVKLVCELLLNHIAEKEKGFGLLENKHKLKIKRRRRHEKSRRKLMALSYAILIGGLFIYGIL